MVRFVGSSRRNLPIAPFIAPEMVRFARSSRRNLPIAPFIAPEMVRFGGASRRFLPIAQVIAQKLRDPTGRTIAFRAKMVRLVWSSRRIFAYCAIIAPSGAGATEKVTQLWT